MVPTGHRFTPSPTSAHNSTAAPPSLASHSNGHSACFRPSFFPTARRRRATQYIPSPISLTPLVIARLVRCTLLYHSWDSSSALTTGTATRSEDLHCRCKSFLQFRRLLRQGNNEGGPQCCQPEANSLAWPRKQLPRVGKTMQYTRSKCPSLKF